MTVSGGDPDALSACPSSPTRSSAAAAWGGQLLACGYATSTLGSVATVASDQLIAATAGR